MPAQKLSYKVDVDTGEAVRDLSRLGKAGADAGKDIADGFDDAESTASKALKALSTSLDKVETDAKGLADAVDAIKAELTIDVDDSKVAGFASDLKNKMGVAFDAIEADAKAFADVLERGVNMDKTTSELRNVGDELDTVRSNSDQSRSVLANMAGNTAQDLGELGGVVGGLGVGLGQLAEYATEGNIGLKDLGKVAGPLAALSAASLLIQGMSSSLADLKKRQEAYTQQQLDFNESLQETGSLQETVNEMLQDNVQLSSAPELNWWQDMMDDLPVLTGMVDETATAMDTGLVGALAAANVSADEFTGALDQGLGPFQALMDKFAAAKDQGLITGEQYDLLTAQLDLYSQTALTAEVQQQNINEVFGTGAVAASNYSKALPDPAEVEALAEASREAAAAIRAQADNSRDAATIMASTEFGAASYDAATSAMQAYFDTATEGQRNIGDLAGAYDGLHEALHAAFGEGNLDEVTNWLPDVTSPEGRAVLDALDELGSALIPQISEAFANSHGDVNKFKADMQSIYDGTLIGLSNQLGISTDDAADLLAQIGLTPDNFETMYQLNGVEEAKLKLQLLQGQIDNLPEYVQLQVQQQIIEGDYEGALETVRNAFARGAKVPIHADTTSAKQTADQFRRGQESTAIRIPVVTYNAGGYRAGSSYGPQPSPNAAGPMVAATAAPAAAPASSTGSTWPTVTVPAPASIVVNVNAGVVGNRYDVSRWLRGALRDQQRLGRIA